MNSKMIDPPVYMITLVFLLHGNYERKQVNDTITFLATIFSLYTIKFSFATCFFRVLFITLVTRYMTFSFKN